MSEYLTSENPSLAINSCDKAVEMAPKSAEIRAYQALVLLNMNQHDAALASTGVTLTLDDTSYLAYLVRAIVRADRETWRPAQDDLGHAIEYAPDDDARAFVRDVAGQILSQEGARSSGGSSRHHVHASRSCSHASPKYAFRTRSSANNVAAGPESTMLPVSST